MTTEVLLELHRAQPFRPFQMRLVDGRSLVVANPEFFLFADDRRCVGIFEPPNLNQIIDLALVISVHYHDANLAGTNRV